MNQGCFDYTSFNDAILPLLCFSAHALCPGFAFIAATRVVASRHFSSRHLLAALTKTPFVFLTERYTFRPFLSCKFTL